MYRVNYRVWAICSGGLCLALWIVMVGAGLRAHHFLFPDHLFRESAFLIALAVAVAAAFGWVVQWLAVLHGGAPRRRRDPQADDYDDRPPAP